MRLRVALTGGIATGKSHCLRQFAMLGAVVVDADDLAHQVLEADSPGFNAVVARFGSEFVRQDGTLDRKKLAALIFSDERARRDLEAIVHPGVYAAIEAWFASHRRRLAIADIPLLFETGRERAFDRVIVARCPPEVQLERLIKRSQLSREEAQLRIDAQIPIEEKARRADMVIDTSGSVEETDRQVQAIWERLQGQVQPA